MKRHNNLFEKICTPQNIERADSYARRNKNPYPIEKHDQNHAEENKALLESLLNLTYKTSKYKKFKIYEPKERIIYRLPYYPDRITHWAIMNVMEDIWVKIFIKHTYSCIQGRGIHKLAADLEKELRQDEKGTKYCLKLDIHKFFPSINHEDLKIVLRKKIKDKKLLTILDEIVESTDGVPIGNYLSQFFANLYLAYLDHWLLEEVKVKHYFRYADDIVILSDNKEFLRKVLILIKIYLHHVLDLELKPNYQVFPVESRGIDFVGYIFYHDHTLLRNSIKRRIFRVIYKYKAGKITEEKLKATMCSYFGWLKHCNSKHLLQKIEALTGLHYSNWNGKLVGIEKFYMKRIKVYEVVKHNKYFELHFVYNHISYTCRSRNKSLFRFLSRVKFPITFKLMPYV